MNPFLRTSTLLTVALLFVTVAPTPAAGAPFGDWYTDFDQALAAARREGKPLLADVGSENCPACRMLESQTLSHPDIQARLSNFIKVQIDGNASPQILRQFSIDAYPTVIALAPNGQTVGRSVGFVPAAKFAGTLDGALQKVGPALAEAKALQEAKAEASEKAPLRELARSDSGKSAKSRTRIDEQEEPQSPAEQTGSSSDQEDSRNKSAKPFSFYNMGASKAKDQSKESPERKVLAQVASAAPQAIILDAALLPSPGGEVPQRLLNLNGKDAQPKNEPAKKSVKRATGSSALATVRKLQSAGSSTENENAISSEEESEAGSAEKITSSEIERWMSDADQHLKAGRKREARAMYNKVLDNDKGNRFGRSDLAFIQTAMLTVDTDDDALRRQAYAKIKEFKARFPNSTREDHYTVMRAILAADLGKTDEAHSLLDPFAKRFPTSRFRDLAYQTWKGLPAVKSTGSSKPKSSKTSGKSGSSARMTADSKSKSKRNSDSE